MAYRLTYALTRDEVVTTDFYSLAPDIVGATEEAFAFIEEEHGAMAVMNLVAFSLLKVEVHKDEQSN